MLDLDRRVVWITGAAGNLGRAAVGRFREAGARLVLVDHASARLAGAFPDLERSADHLLADGVDMTDPGAVQAMGERALARFGRVDALLHALGGFTAGPPVHETDLDVWDRMLALNLRSAVLGVRAAVPAMLRQGSGHIVLVAGRPALAAPAGMAAYAAAKSAVLRLGEGLSEELKDAGIRVNCIVPGILDTPDNRRAMPGADRSRWVEPAAVADVALFLVSQASRAVTGAAIPVYGTG